MSKYFEFDYSGGAFALFGPAHLWTVVAMVLFSVVFLRTGRSTTQESRVNMRKGLVLFLVALDLGSNVFWAASGAWSVKWHLPFQMCTATTYVMAYAFLTGNRRLYPLVYFLGIGGAIQAVITPDAGVYGFPHLRFFDALLSHGGLVLGGFWVVLVEGVRPKLRDLIRIMVGLNVYALLMYFLNLALGSNYLYVNGKAEVDSAMNFMPEWPYYILVLEALVIIVFGLMYLPFRRYETGRLAGSGDVSA
ncbi:MAG: putative integral membrane protein (TIGR02206 family) [Rhodothermales bacterium]|jgi:hypothetical integral membrane protein (TIGR02206 family)